MPPRVSGRGGGVYALTCAVTGRVYIGSSANLTTRQYRHFHDLKNGTHNNAAMQADFADYPDAFTFSVLSDGYARHELKEAEQRAVVEMRLRGIPLYNCREPRPVSVTSDEDFARALDAL